MVRKLAVGLAVVLGTVALGVLILVTAIVLTLGILSFLFELLPALTR
jgi:hypothetical protein